MNGHEYSAPLKVFFFFSESRLMFKYQYQVSIKR